MSSEQQIDLTTLDASGLADRLGSLRRFVCRSSRIRHPRIDRSSDF